MPSLAATLNISYGDEKELIRDRVTAAFKDLRKLGLIARSGFSCCRGCAGGELASYVEGLPEKRQAKVKGCVFYTRQDRDAFAGRHPFRGLWLAYGPLNLSNDATVGLPTEEVGALVVTALRARGLDVEWDGTADACIKVNGLHPGIEAAAVMAGPKAALS